MKTAELRKKSTVELNEYLGKLLRELFALKIKLANHDESVKNHKFKLLRRSIARVKTIQNESLQSVEKAAS